MLGTPFSPWPVYTDEEIAAVARVLESGRVNYWTGDEGRRFEEEFAARIGTRHAVALANGTVALEAALRAIAVGPGHEVVVTPRSFIASAATPAIVGATPVFADVDRDTQNITAETIARVLTPRTRAVICVHLAGLPCDMDPIMQLASERNLTVIEDCAQAHGATYRGREVGGIGHIGAWSFCQDKIMTLGGEGGMITTDDPDIWSAVWSYKDHGKSWEAVYERAHPPGFRWLHSSFGTNLRMTEMQATIGRVQLGRLDDWSRRRNHNADRLAEACRQLPLLRLPRAAYEIRHAYYRFYAFIRPEWLADGWDRDRIVAEINELGVPCYHGACGEIYREEAFEGSDYRVRRRLPGARELDETSMMFLVHPTLTDSEISRTCEVIRDVVSRAQRETTTRRAPVTEARPGPSD